MGQRVSMELVLVLLILSVGTLGCAQEHTEVNATLVPKATSAAMAEGSLSTVYSGLALIPGGTFEMGDHHDLGGPRTSQRRGAGALRPDRQISHRKNRNHQCRVLPFFSTLRSRTSPLRSGMVLSTRQTRDPSSATRTNRTQPAVYGGMARRSQWWNIGPIIRLSCVRWHGCCGLLQLAERGKQPSTLLQHRHMGMRLFQ